MSKGGSISVSANGGDASAANRNRFWRDLGEATLSSGELGPFLVRRQF